LTTSALETRVQYGLNKDMVFSILSCGVFESELAGALKRGLNAPLEVRFFDAALHMRPDLMREKIFEELAKFSAKNEAVLLLFGLCGNAALGLKSDAFKLVIPRVHECLGLFLGSPQNSAEFRKENPRSYFASPGWTRAKVLPSKELYETEKARYLARYDAETAEELATLFLEQFKPYDTISYAEFAPDGAARLYCKDCARFMGWRFNELTAQREFFEDAVNARWDERFFILPKGATIKPSHDESLFTY